MLQDFPTDEDFIDFMKKMDAALEEIDEVLKEFEEEHNFILIKEHLDYPYRELFTVENVDPEKIKTEAKYLSKAIQEIEGGTEKMRSYYEAYFLRTYPFGFQKSISLGLQCGGFNFILSISVSYNEDTDKEIVCYGKYHNIKTDLFPPFNKAEIQTLLEEAYKILSHWKKEDLTPYARFRKK